MHNVHISVLKQEILDFCPVGAGNVFDATLGGGGHTIALLEKGAKVVSSDLDINAIERVESIIPDTLRAHWTPIHAGFDEALKMQPNNSIDYLIADLGFSSNQLESGGRGFSYLEQGDVLDLRYNAEKGIPCWRLIQKTQKDDLGKIIYTYSGEKFAGRIAAELDIVKRDKPDLKVADLVAVVTKVLPAKFQKKRNSILSRVWQALRIWTNDEFKHLEKLLDYIPDKLAPGGRAAIICFHSLEDKMVTKRWRMLTKPLVIDEYGNTEQRFLFLTKEAVVPSETEIISNPRSRSATLRVIERKA